MNIKIFTKLKNGEKIEPNEYRAFLIWHAKQIYKTYIDNKEEVVYLNWLYGFSLNPHCEILTKMIQECYDMTKRPDAEINTFLSKQRKGETRGLTNYKEIANLNQGQSQLL